MNRGRCSGGKAFGGLLLVSAVLVPAVLVPASVTVAAARASEHRIVAFADTRQLPDPQTADRQIKQLQTLYCAGPGEKPRTVSLQAALTVARMLVADDSHGHGLALVSSSPIGHTEARAIAGAAGALATGKPAAALAALLRAHELAPKDPVPLIDAAPLLTQAGRGDEALALIAAAEREKLPHTDPLGINWRALIAGDRGEALIVTHRFAAAQQALRSAIAQAPLLAEANQNLAVDEACMHRHQAAVHYLVAAVHRQEFPPYDYVGVTSANPFGQLDSPEVLDTSRGAPLTLENLKFPQSLSDAKAMWHPMLNISNAIPPADTRIFSQQNSDDQAMNRRLAHKNALTQQRTIDIIRAAELATEDLDLKSPYDQAIKLETEITRLQARTEGQGGCMDHGASWGQWKSLLHAYDAAWRRYASALYQRQTAYAANLKDPLAHQVALDWATVDAEINFSVLVNGGWVPTTGYAAICYTPETGTNDPESGKRHAPTSPPCPSGLNGPEFSLNLIILSFSVNCEEATIEVEAGEGWLNGFVSGSHNFKTGSNTICVGAEAGVKINVGPLSGGPSARGGVYVTFGPDGTVQDSGLRAGTSVGATIGPGTATISGPETSISFSDALSP